MFAISITNASALKITQINSPGQRQLPSGPEAMEVGDESGNKICAASKEALAIWRVSANGASQSSQCRRDGDSERLMPRLRSALAIPH
jgi:hypothetical protein